MKLIAFLAAPILALAFMLPAEAEDGHYLTVTGQGKVSTTPDEGYFSTGVTTHKPTATKAFNENAKMMNAVFKALSEAGVAEEDIQTTHLSLHQHWKIVQAEGRKTKRVKDGFMAHTEVRVTISEIANFGKVLDAAAGSGVTNMSAISFGNSNAEELKDQARSKAVADAIRKAQIMASRFGIELGKPVVISEGNGLPVQPLGYAKTTVNSATMPVAIGTRSYSAYVTVRWKLD